MFDSCRLLKPDEARTHGFQRPHTAMQRVCVLYTVVAAIVYFGILCPNFAVLVRSFLIAVGATLFLTVATTYLWASRLDPSHPALRKSSSPADHVVTGPKAVYCKTCKVYMSLDDKVKHCRTCKRCVPKFDHHCPALNNCVGQRNFKITVVLFNSALLLSLLLNITYGLLLLGYLNNHELLVDWKASNALLVFGWPVSGPLILASVGTFALFNTAVILSLFALVGYHWYNIFQEMSTYDQIKQERAGQSKRYEMFLSVNLFTCQTKKRLNRGPRRIQDQNMLEAVEDEERTPGASRRSSKSTFDPKVYDTVGIHKSLPFDLQWERLERLSKERGVEGRRPSLSRILKNKQYLDTWPREKREMYPAGKVTDTVFFRPAQNPSADEAVAHYEAGQSSPMIYFSQTSAPAGASNPHSSFDLTLNTTGISQAVKKPPLHP